MFSLKNNKYAQAAFEFTLLMAIGTLFLLIFIILSATFSAHAINEQRRQTLLDFGYTLQDELIIATSVHSGYERVITVPDSLGKFNYEIVSTNKKFTLSSAQQSYDFRIPEISGSLVKGTNIISFDGTLSVIQT